MGTVAIASIRRGNTHPSSFIAWSGAVASLVAALTDSSSLTAKDRSRILRYSRDLCGMAAIGESLRRVDIVVLSCDQGIILANPCSTCSLVSVRSAVAAAGSCADACAPRWTAASSRSMDQFTPQSTGHPRSAYVRSNGAAGWERASPVGDINCWRWDLLLFGVAVVGGACVIIGVVVGWFFGLRSGSCDGLGGRVGGSLVFALLDSLIWLTALFKLCCIARSNSFCHSSFARGTASVVLSIRLCRLLDFLLVGLRDAVLNLILGLSLCI